MVRAAVANYLGAYRAGTVPLYPALLGLAYCLHLYWSKWGLTEPEELYLPFLILGGLALITSASQKLGTAAGVFVIANMVSGSLGFIATIAPITLVIITLAYAAVIWRKRINLRSISRWMNVFSLIFLGLVILTFAPLAVGWHLRDAEAHYTAPVVDWQQVEYQPDIYYIIPDGYANLTGMATAYRVSNGQIYRDLEAAGYTVDPYAISNYPLTLPTLSSALNFDYTLLPGGDEHIRSLKVRLNNPQVFSELQQGGYQYVHAGGNWILNGHEADANLSAAQGFTTTAFHTRLIAETVLPLIIGMIGGEHAYYHVLHRENLDIAANLAEAVTLNVDGPKFVVVHWLLPHPPFYLTEACQFDPHASGYGAQALCVNQMIREAVALIPEDAVVIIQADHGAWAAPLSYEDAGIRGATAVVPLTDTEIIETRLGNFAAYRNLDAYPRMTPVNTWRVLFDQYFGTDMGRLEDRHYMIPGYSNLNEVYPALE